MFAKKGRQARPQDGGGVPAKLQDRRQASLVTLVQRVNLQNHLPHGVKKQNFLRHGVKKQNFLRHGVKKQNLLRHGVKKQNFLRHRVKKQNPLCHGRKIFIDMMPERT